MNESDVLNINGNTGGGGPITFNGTIAGGNGSGTRIIQLNNGNGTGALTFNGIISDGSGTMEMKQLGGNTSHFWPSIIPYSGGTTISAGTVQVGNGGTTGTLAQAVWRRSVRERRSAFDRNETGSSP